MQTPVWQQALADGFSDPASLLAYLKLEPTILPAQRHAGQQFSLRVPRDFADLMQPGDPDDPLLRQVLPLAEEMETTPGFGDNPVGDREAEATPGLLHKYPGRVLIVATGACAVHCRYCFRRHFSYGSGSASPRLWAPILGYLRDHPEVEEVILSGGDPLMLSDERLTAWLEQLSVLPHLKRLRLHTRLPVVVPQRVTAELVALLRKAPLLPLVVLHANHPNEISPQVIDALGKLKTAGITLLNQSVLLRGVNDDGATLARLSERLFQASVLPYYLHLLDRVAGAAHFEVPEAHARSLHRELLARLPGYLVPKLVREIAGEASKTPVDC